MRRRLMAGAASLAVAAGSFLAAAPAAHGAVTVTTKKMLAYEWAVANEKGCWYVWAGAGPCGRGYDCSGAVMRAFEAVGIYLPHNVAMMLSSGKLRWIPAYEARKGDLAVWGNYHVEFVSYLTRWTFGAQDSGTRVGWHRTWGQPQYYEVRGSG